MKTLRFFLLTINIFLALFASAQYKIEVLDSNSFHLGEGVILSKISFRGLCVVDDHLIWVSGSKGIIAKSIDGGKTFSFQQLKGYEKSDFRDIEAFDDKRAIIMSSGTPAYILKTINGGQTWKEVYKNTDISYFLDAMDFWNDKKGMLVGDPINGHFLLLQTNDGGETWQQLDTSKTPKAFQGEAVFAASGTSLRCWSEEDFGFVSGGKESRFIFGSDLLETIKIQPKYKINSWRYTSIQKGMNSQGAFSLTLFDQKINGILLVGGNYLSDNDSLKNSNYIALNAHIDFRNYIDTKGYKSCVETINYTNKIAIATGTSGTDYFEEFKWTNFSKESFNVVRKAKKGKAVFLAGGKGKIGKLIY